MNWFLEAIKCGDYERVKSALENSCEDQKTLLLKSKTLAGYGPARVAIEVNDENMLDIILQHVDPEHFLQETDAMDGKSDFVRAIEKNPDWFSKFIHFDDDLSNILFQAICVADIDDQIKYKNLWKRFTACLQEDQDRAYLFIRKAIRKRKRNLSLHWWNTFGQDIAPEFMFDLMEASVKYGNVPLFQGVLPRLTSNSGILSCIASNGQSEMLSIFLKSEPKLTCHDLQSACQSRVKLSDLSAIMNTGILLKDLALPKQPNLEKWAAFLNAGFFIETEKKFALIGPKTQAFVHDMLCLASLAVIQVRENLLSGFQKNLEVVCREKLSDLPEVMRNQIQRPYSKLQIKNMAKL